MSSQEEVLKIGKKLEKIIANDSSDPSSTVDLLKALKKLPITLEVLQKTKIGVTVNNLRKVCKDEESISLSKSVIKSWKKLVPENGGSSGSGKSHSGESSHKESSHKDSSSRRESSHRDSNHKGSSHSSGGSSRKSDHGDHLPASRCGSGSTSARSTSAASVASVSSAQSDESEKSVIERSDSLQSTDSVTPDSDSVTPMDNDSVNPVEPNASSIDDEGDTSSPEKQTESCTEDSGLQLSPRAPLPRVEVDDTSDPVRIKCREMLAAALNNPPDEMFKDGEIIAAEIEHFVFKHFENTDAKYRNRIRSRITNLKDTRNPHLKQSVMWGNISPKQFSMMSAEEMASDEMKKLRDKLAKEAFNDHQMSTNSGTKSDLFKCGRCGKRNTTYNQLQTRSSDEPMTTFVFCNECGNRWKFC